MHIERFFVPGLAHASYLVASGNEAVVVDPERNVGGYLYLARNKLKLNGIFLTHPHADFVASHARAFRSIRRFDLCFCGDSTCFQSAAAAASSPLLPKRSESLFSKGNLSRLGPENFPSQRRFTGARFPV